MDYREKYNNALDWMRNVYPMLTGADKEDAEHYFPELKESGDDKIRKAISVAICGTTAEAVLEANGVKLVDALSYLEKQKEQKPSPEDVERNEGFWEGVKATRENFWEKGIKCKVRRDAFGMMIIQPAKIGDLADKDSVTSLLALGDEVRIIFMKDGEVIDE